MDTQKINKIVNGYFDATTRAVNVLLGAGLLPHTLVIIYSTIDTCGLLDAHPGQDAASSDSFKAWVEAYVLAGNTLDFNAVDLWGARCSVLHTFTAESKLSKVRKARELQYYTGEKSAPKIKEFIEFINKHEEGKYLAVHYGDLVAAVLKGMGKFVPALVAKCEGDAIYSERLGKVIRQHSR